MKPNLGRKRRASRTGYNAQNIRLQHGATGGSVSLSAASYSALVNTQVNQFNLAHSLALREGLVGGTYAQAFPGTVPLETFLAALANAAPGQAATLLALANQASLGNATVNLAQLIDFGPFANVSLSDPNPNVTATASLASLVQGALQLGGSAHLITLKLAPNIPGIASATGLLSLGEPPQGSALIAVDQTGSAIHTAQHRLYLNVALAGTPAAPLVNLPLYLEVGYGSASLAGLSCNALDATSTTATLNVTPGLVNGWVGTVTAAQMVDYTTEPLQAPATLVNLGLATVTGTADATIGNIAPTALNFSYTDIQNQTVKTTSTTDFIGSLVTNLVGHTTLTVAGVPIPGLPTAVAGVLTSAAIPLDQLITSVLQTTGVTLGSASTAINGARCGAAMLAE